MLSKYLKNNLFKNTGIYTISSILNAAVPFLLLPILTRYLSPEDYGIVSIFSLLVAFTSPFIGLSVNGAITRQYFNQENVDLWRYIGNCILILMISSGIVAITYYAFAESIADISSFPIQYIWIIVVYSLAQFLANIPLVLWQVKKNAIRYSIFVLLKTFVNFILSIVFVACLSLGWRGRLYGQLITILIFAIISIFYLLKNDWIKISFEKKYFLNALAFGVPLIPHNLSGSIISMTDRLFITNMVGLGATGIYSVGYQVGSIINILTNSFNNAYVPWLYERLKQNSKSKKIKIVKFTYIYFVGIMLLAVGFGLAAPYILKVFLGKSFDESSVYVVWISIGYAFNGMYLMVVNYIFFVEKTKFLAVITMATSIINVILNFFLIRSYGAIGAAKATTLTFAIKFILVWMISAKLYEMPWKRIR